MTARAYVREQQKAWRERRQLAYDVAQLTNAKRLPSIGRWLGDFRTKALTKAEADARAAEFEEAVKLMGETIILPPGPGNADA